MNKDSLGDRIKKYESVTQHKLISRLPVIMRIDGKAFHSWTKKMKCDKPFDDDLIGWMIHTALNLCKNMSGVKFCFVQSDEMNFVLTDYEKLETEAWFDNKIQKMASVSASLATGYFNNIINAPQTEQYPIANFDSRVFNIPKEEVVNYFLWRQNDWTRNSIQMAGRSKFSHKQLEGVSCDQIQEMLFRDFKINWNDYEPYKKRGTSIFKLEGDGWVIDTNNPIFSQDRNYIERHLVPKET